ALPVESTRPIVVFDGIVQTPLNQVIWGFVRWYGREATGLSSARFGNIRQTRGSTTRSAGGGRSIHPAIHGAHARLGHQEVVADRLAAAVLDGARGGDQTEDPARLVAVVGLGVGVHLEVPDRQAVVPLEPL